MGIIRRDIFHSNPHNPFAVIFIQRWGAIDFNFFKYTVGDPRDELLHHFPSILTVLPKIYTRGTKF